jgi:hypothetical protein
LTVSCALCGLKFHIIVYTGLVEKRYYK